MANSSLTGKSVIVTGGASGIGLAIVRLFALHSTTISILDISASSAQKVLTSLTSEFPNTKFIFKKCDISDWEEQKHVFEEIYEETGSVDIVIANAGIVEKGVFLEVEHAEPQKPDLRTLDVNLTGTLYTVRLAVHYMRKKSSVHKGCIICTASNAGIYPFPIAPLYGTSKHAVVGAVRSMARPLEKDGITINGLAPAVIGKFPHPPTIPPHKTNSQKATGLADDRLFSSMILTPVSTAVNAVEQFVTDTKLSGVIAEIHGEKHTFRPPPEYVDADSAKNLEMFWTLGYS